VKWTGVNNSYAWYVTQIANFGKIAQSLGQIKKIFFEIITKFQI
jgi:hypothetical protein